MLSNFKFDAKSSFNDFLGFFDMGSYTAYCYLKIEAYIPTNFVITEAKLTLIHDPVLWSKIDGSSFWGYSRNIRAYSVNNKSFTRVAYVQSDIVDVLDEANLQEIQGALGANGFTARTPSNANHIREIKNSIDVKEYLDQGDNMLLIKTENVLPSYASDEVYKQTGTAWATLNVVGYVS